jgi:hypothetical protein
MTTTTCADDWRKIAEKAAREAREWRENFDVLQRALVGETGASGIEVAHALRKDAERYRKLIASGNFCAGTFGGWALRCGGSPDTKMELDAAVDALPAVGDA